MPTIPELKARLRRYGLPVSGRKAVLIHRIDKAYYDELRNRLLRAYNAKFECVLACGAPREPDVQDILAKDRRLLEQTEAALRATAYAKNTKRNRELRLAAQNKLAKRRTLAATTQCVLGPHHQREPPARFIVREGARLLQDREDRQSRRMAAQREEELTEREGREEEFLDLDALAPHPVNFDEAIAIVNQRGTT